MNKKRNVIGKCKLCLKDDVKLLDSHFMPAFLYNYMNALKIKGGSINILQIDSVRRSMGDHQLTKNILCEDCEKKFNTNGEEYFKEHALVNIHRSDDASFGYIPNVFKSMIKKLYYKNILIGNLESYNEEKMFYFCSSIFWRGTVDWNAHDHDKRTRPCVYDETLLNEMKNVLLGSKEKTNYKIMIVPLINKSYFSCCPPTSLFYNKNGRKHYCFQIFQYLFILCEKSFLDSYKIKTEKNIFWYYNPSIEHAFNKKLTKNYHSSVSKAKTDNSQVSWMNMHNLGMFTFPGSMQPMVLCGRDYIITSLTYSFNRY
ncbi:hypothetical protein [Providencia stuartii]|uniref:hypothetical protein n=1 Tax=Providencia stuartii TaxID=588 RepID=UPI0024B1E27F